MPITLKTPSFITPDTDLSITFQATEANGDPTANTQFTASRQFNTMGFSNPSTSAQQISGTTDANGNGTFSLYADFPNGAFNSIAINAGLAVDRVPVGVYSPSLDPNIVVEGGHYENGDIVVDNDVIISNGLKFMVTFPNDHKPDKDEIIFLCIGSYFTYNIVDIQQSTAVFRLPAGFSGTHPLNNDNSLFYGVIKKSGNCVVPNLTKIVVKGAPQRLDLLQPSINSFGGEYINIYANSLGVTLSIPVNENNISVNDSYQLVYSTHENLSLVTEIKSGVIEDNSVPTEYTTPPQFFPPMNNTPAWFWYIITDSSGVSHASRVTSRIIDTM